MNALDPSSLSGPGESLLGVLGWPGVEVTMAALDTLSPSARAALLQILVRLSEVDGPPDADARRALAGARRALGLPAAPAGTAELSAHERQLIYCAAEWMTLADGVTVREESRALSALSAELGLDPEIAAFLRRQARWVRTSTGDLPAHRELDLLLTEVARRLRAVAARRAA